MGSTDDTDGTSDTRDDFVANVSELAARNAEFAAAFDGGDLQVAPLRRLAVVACMDSRMDIFKLLGLRNGEAHIIRNAGGVITDDVIRSLCLSQRALGTREIVLVHHTDCGLHNLDEAEFRRQLEDEIGVKPWWSLEAFTDPFRDIEQSIQRLYLTPFIRHKEHISGFVYDVHDGQLHEVSVDSPDRS